MRNTPSGAGQAANAPAHGGWLIDAFHAIDEMRARRAAAQQGATAWDALVAAGVDDARVRELVCARSGCGRADFAAIAPDAASLLGKGVASRYLVVPLCQQGRRWPWRRPTRCG